MDRGIPDDRSRRKQVERGLRSEDFFALRTPALPFDAWVAAGDGAEATSAADSQLRDALARDRERARTWMRACIASPAVREAIFLASPVLDESIPHWLRDPDSDRGRKIERSLYRYLARMSARPTPFGLFAGCALGAVGGASGEIRLDLLPASRSVRHSRLDMDFLCALAEAVASAPGALPHLVLVPNDTLAAVAGQARWAAAWRDGEARRYRLRSATATGPLLATVDRARGGATPDALADALVADNPAIAPDEASRYVARLVETQVLLPLAAPQVTGDEPARTLATELGALPGGEAAGAALRAAVEVLAELDAAGPGAPPDRYRALAASFEGLPVAPVLQRLVQVDLIRQAEDARLPRGMAGEVRRGIALLHHLAPAEDGLQAFRDAFVRRFGDEEIPLLQALDEEAGVGFRASQSPAAAGEPLVADVPLGEAPAQVPFAARDAALLARVAPVLAAGGRELRLFDDDWPDLATPRPLPLPSSLAALVRIAAPSRDDAEGGRFEILVEAVHGPNGAALLGRFCHADPALEAAVRRHLAAEEESRPDAVFAEVVHLPEGRIGNVLLRPVLRGYEIPLLGRSGASPERRIGLDDLTVAVVDERVVLRSRRLGREVLPRLTTAHNHAAPRNLGIYRFLCALQTQGVAGALSFPWGALDAFPFLPRVTAGRLVLSLARWRLDAITLSRLEEIPPGSRWREVQELRRALGLPRLVEWVEADNRLPVDLDDPIAVDAFALAVAGRPGAVLRELWPGAEGQLARSPEGRFAHEIVLPFRGPAPPAPARIRPAPVTVPRTFPPGSEWLMARIYSGPATSDRLLLSAVRPVVDEALRTGAADGWFFIRYTDPDWHLRVRLHGDPGRLVRETLPALAAALAPFLGSGACHRFDLGTYEREVDRYGGGEAMPLAERLFQADSEAALDLLPLFTGDPGADVRWRAGLLGVHRWLLDLGLDLPARRRVVEAARDDLGGRVHAGAAAERRVGDRFRRERGPIRSLLRGEWGQGSPFATASAVLDRRTEAARPGIAALHALAASGALQHPTEALARSYAHMWANRVFRSAAVPQEWVVYGLLARAYAEQAARVS